MLPIITTAAGIAGTALAVHWRRRARHAELTLQRHLDAQEFTARLEQRKRRDGEHTLTTNGAGR